MKKLTWKDVSLKFEAGTPENIEEELGANGVLFRASVKDAEDADVMNDIEFTIKRRNINNSPTTTSIKREPRDHNEEDKEIEIIYEETIPAERFSDVKTEPSEKSEPESGENSFSEVIKPVVVQLRKVVGYHVEFAEDEDVCCVSEEKKKSMETGNQQNNQEMTRTRGVKRKAQTAELDSNKKTNVQ